MDKQQYACSAANKLLNTDIVINAMDLNKTVYTINRLLTDSAKECYPDRKKEKKKSKLKVMNPNIQNVIQEKKRKAFYLWKQNGRSNNLSIVFLLEKKIKTIERRRQIRIEIAKRRQIEKKNGSYQCKKVR